MVSDTIIRELAHDFARQQAIIIDMQRSEVQCDTIINRQAREIQSWKDAEKFKSDELWRCEKKARRRKVDRWIERVAVVIAFFSLTQK